LIANFRCSELNGIPFVLLSSFSPLQLFFFAFAATALVALSASFVSATFDVKLIAAEDNTMPFFIGSENLVGVSTAISTAATDNAAISSLADTALSQKYDNATITAWRRLMGNATLVASAGPSLSGEIKCYVGDNGEVVGLQYGSAVVCKSSSRVVNVKIGTNYLSNIKVSISCLLFCTNRLRAVGLPQAVSRIVSPGKFLCLNGTIFLSEFRPPPSPLSL